MIAKTISKTDFKEFQKKFPNIAKILLNPEKILNNEDILMKLKKDVWQSVGHKIMHALWKSKGAMVFHEEVDPEKLQISDYFDVVKNPMDFGTIR